jgi:hypothetical protein
MIRFSKIRLILGCCLLLVLFSSCRPKGVLSRKEMVSVLVDIHLTEAAVSEISEPIPEEWTRGLDTEYFKDMAYRSVLRKHHLSQDDFYYSVSWYSRHMNLYEKVYIDVQTKLDEFKVAIEEGAFDNSSSMSIYGLDTAKTRSLYTYGAFRRDTVPVHPLYLIGDSLPSNSRWYAKQWMYRMPKDTTRLNLYPKSSIHSVFNTSDPDSLKIKADSLLQQNAVQITSRNGKVIVVAPGGRRLPTRNFREVPKNEQIRKRFQQRVVEQEQLKRLETEQQRKARIEASKQVEPNHWK